MGEHLITHTIGGVLAGGSSSRMGRDKAALVVQGDTFLDRVVDSVSAAVSEVTVYGGTQVPTNGVLVQDDQPGQGPLGGLVTAMRRSKGRPVLVVSVDTPLVTEDVIRSLIVPETPPDVVRLATAGGRIHPLVGVYGSAIMSVAQTCFDRGKRSVLSVIDEVERVVEVEVDAEAVFNVNTEADYRMLIERYGP